MFKKHPKILVTSLMALTGLLAVVGYSVYHGFKPETALRLVGETSVNPVLYTDRQFETDLAKDYPQLSKDLDGGDGPAYYTIPGLAQSDTISLDTKQATFSDDLDPQGLTIAEDYLIISAYSESKAFRSVLWLIDRKSGHFVKTIVLPDDAHVGGIAYDDKHKKLWIATSDASISSLSYQQLVADDFLKTKQAITYQEVYLLNDIYLASYMTYYNDTLFVGYFDENHKGNVGYYPLDTKGLPDSNGADEGYLNAQQTYRIPDQIQGMTVSKDKVIFSQSFGDEDSNLLLFDNQGLEKWRDFTTADLRNQVSAPPYLEEIELRSGHIYLLFESGSLRYREDKSLFNIDRVLTIDSSYLDK